MYIYIYMYIYVYIYIHIYVCICTCMIMYVNIEHCISLCIHIPCPLCHPASRESLSGGEKSLPMLSLYIYTLVYIYTYI